MGKHVSREFQPLQVAVLTVSDTRTRENDTSGAYLVEQLQEAGHRIADRLILRDDLYHIRAVVAAWVAEPPTQVVLITGGTGFTERDSTPEAVRVLFDREVDGFGELFRHLSWQEIGTSTLQSRAVAGFSNDVLICALPGSTGACQTAWEGILRDQLDSRHGPCNFVARLRQT